MSEVINLFTEQKQEELTRTKCQIWTRGMGYYRPVSNFNIGKKSEFKERQFFSENVALSSAACIEKSKKIAA
jgi:hypothetical protein